MSLVIAVYRLKDEKHESHFLELMRLHRKVLIGNGLVKIAPILCVADNQHFLEIVQWDGQASAKAAHETPAVQKLWGELAEICEFESLHDIPNGNRPFAGFERVEGALHTRNLRFSDTMIAASKYEKLTQFYEQLLDIKARPEKGYSMLDDSDTGQLLCITEGKSVSKNGLGIETDDLGAAIDKLKSLGATIESTFEYPGMRGAKALDPESNELLVFQIQRN